MKTLPLYVSALLACLLSNSFLHAQANLNDIIRDNIFQEFFNQLNLSPEGHGAHFNPAREEVANALTPALNRSIVSNISSFPLSSTSSGRTFDFSTGLPLKQEKNLGPIFAETGKTLGKGRVNVGINYTHLDFARLRGIRTQDIHFAFNHQNVDPNGNPVPLEGNEILGDNINESDVMDVFLDLDLSANLGVFFFTLGVTNSLDLSVAIPGISIQMDVNARAVMNSLTFPLTGVPNHHFGQNGQDWILESRISHSESYQGIGDITVRLKQSFANDRGVNAGLLLDTRLPTGDPDNFTGTGEVTGRLMGILSQKIEGFTYHMNLGYDYRGDSDSDEFEAIVGFDQQLAPGFAVAVDFLGEIDVQSDQAVTFLEGGETLEIFDRVIDPQTGFQVGQSRKEVDRTNIPRRTEDNILNLAVGFRVAPSDRIIFLGNLLMPLNDGGLRTRVAPTLGLTVSL